MPSQHKVGVQDKMSGADDSLQEEMKHLFINSNTRTRIRQMTTQLHVFAWTRPTKDRFYTAGTHKIERMHECVADPSKLPHIQCCELRGLCLVMLGSCRDVYPLTELEHKINSKQNMIMHKKWLAALCWSCEEQYHEFHHSNSIF